MQSAIDQIRAPEAATVRYTIDAKISQFRVRAFATGLLSAFGHDPTIAIPGFEGEVLLNLDKFEDSVLRIVIDATSLKVTDDIGEKDREEVERRMHEEVLEDDGYPEIVYECSRLSAVSKIGEAQYWAALNGQLSLHGVTRPQVVSVRITTQGEMLRAVGEFSVRQSDYEIKPVSAVGGAVRVKDELKCSFDISARRQI